MEGKVAKTGTRTSIPRDKALAMLYRDMEHSCVAAASALASKKFYSRAARFLDMAELANIRAAQAEGGGKELRTQSEYPDKED